MALKDSLEVVRAAALHLQATGADGFEGLAAELLARWAGLHVRSARAGYQAGHDGGTVRNRISLLFEAKRYDATDIRPRELLGEIDIVLQDHPDLDLYVIASTQRLGSVLEQRMGKRADGAGAELLILDWDGDMPLLAAFLAGQPDAALAWFERHAPSVDRIALAAALSGIGSDPGFAASASSISLPLSAATLGLETLRTGSASALQALFRERAAARRRFKQHLAPADVEMGAVGRPTLMDAVDDWHRDGTDSRFLAVLGDEGVGKSWTIPQWWLAQGDDRPILLVATSNFVRDRVEVEDGRRFIAELIAFTLGERSAATVGRWESRLGRWSAAAHPRGRFLVILDGLNEATRVDWSSLVDAVLDSLSRLGGRLAVTCRRAFFVDEVRDRLPGARIYRELPVGVFSPEELTAAAAARDVDVASMGEEVRKFIANPRIFAIAAGLLPELAAGQLTVPRLLMMAWRSRMSERGNFVVHGDNDMRRLVASHGRAIRDGRTAFEVDAWKEHSSRSRRSADVSLDDDLTEVVEGTFCEPIPDRPGEYRIRDRAFGFALGLMLVEELRAASAEARAGILADALDELSGFDRTTEILAAAVAIAMLDPASDPSLCADLLCAWLDLQNLQQRDLDDFVAYAADRPAVYLDVVERVHAVAVRSNRMWPVAALREASGDPRVASLVRARCRVWMGYWHLGDRYPPLRIDDAAHRAAIEARASERIATIATAIEALGPAEREVFERTCRHVDSVHLPNIALVVPFLLAGQPIADCVDGLVGWMLAIEVAERSVTGGGLSWVFALDAADRNATSAACLAAADSLLAIAECRATRNAAARLFAMSGTAKGERRSQDIFEMPPAFAAFADADGDPPDPLDPGASAPPSHALPSVDGIDPAAIRAAFGTGPQDHALDRMAPDLARHDPGPLIGLWRDAVAGIGRRDGMGVRQLVIELPRLSPLFEPPHVAAVQILLAALRAPDHFLRRDASIFAAGHLAQALLPHLDADAQLDLLAGMPPTVSWPDDVHRFLVPVSPQRFEAALAAAVAGGASGGPAPILLFAVDGRQGLTPAAVDMIAACLADPCAYVRSLAFRIAVAAGLAGVLRRHLAGAWTAGETTSYEAYFGSIALARAAQAEAVAMPFGRMASQAHGYAAALGTREDQEVWLAASTAAVGRVAGSTAGSSPPIDVARSAARGAFETSFPYFAADRDEARETSEAPLADLLHASAPDVAIAQRREDNASRSRRIDELLTSLRADGMTFVADAPSPLGFEAVAGWDEQRLRDLARMLADIDDEAATARLHNLAMSLVPPLSRIDGGLAADLFSKMFGAPAFMPFRVGAERTPYDLDVLFAAADVPHFTEVRARVARRAASDASLARLVLAAAMRGKEACIHAMARAAVASGHPRDTALGMTLLGFCGEIDDEVERLLRPFLDGRGFMSHAARSAMQASGLNRRARHWADAAEHADDPGDFWRFSELAVLCADYRYATWYRPPVLRGTSPWSRFAGLFERALSNSASKVADARGKTLYGSEKPHESLAPLLGLDERLPLQRGG